MHGILAFLLIEYNISMYDNVSMEEVEITHQENLEYGVKFEICANCIKIREYSNLKINVADGVPAPRKKKKIDEEEIGLGDYADIADDEKTIKMRNYNYMRRMRQRHAELKEMVANNFETGQCCFLTLTFKEKVTDLTDALHEFKKFIQRMHRRYASFAYVAVASRQRNNRIHFHIICNINNVKYKELSKIWGKGISHTRPIENLEDLRNTQNYLWKNLQESKDEKCGRYAIYHSKNIRKNMVLRSWNSDDIMQFNEVAEQVMNSQVKLDYNATFTAGIERTTYDCKGNLYTEKLSGIPLTDDKKQAGYTEIKSEFSHYHTNIDLGLINRLPMATKIKQKKEK